MARTQSVKNLRTKTFKRFAFTGAYHQVMLNPERHGLWLCWGQEKMGKTQFSLILSNYLSQTDPVLYISAEEGTDADFVDSTIRAQISHENKLLKFLAYESILDIRIRLSKPKAPKIVFLDNLTIYADELKYGELRRLLLDFPAVLFIMLAHEDKGEPYTATAKLAKRLAKIIFYIEGLSCTVSGRCPGGKLIINEEKAALYHGQN